MTASDPDGLSNLTPGSKEFVDSAAYDDMRSFRKPIVTTHEYVFFLLLIAVVFHVAGVVFTEVRERSGLVSAMFTGRKIFDAPPSDEVEGIQGD